MSVLLTILVYFVLFGTMFGLPVSATVFYLRLRDRRLQRVLKGVKHRYRLRGRGRAQLVGRIHGRPIRITRDVRRGVVVSVDLLASEVRRRHAQWPRERAQAFTRTFRRLLAYSGAPHIHHGDRIEGRWTFALGGYPGADALDRVLHVIDSGLGQEALFAEIAAAANEAESPSARNRLADVAESTELPPWLRAEAYRALIGQARDTQELEAFGARLADAPHPMLRRLSAKAWDRIPGQRAGRAIRALLGDDHPTVVETAARVLAARTARDDHAAEALLLARLRSESGPLLFVIVRALGAVGSSRALAEMARWCDATANSVTMREAVWRESTRIRVALGLTRRRNGGQLSLPPGGGELSPPMPDSL